MKSKDTLTDRLETQAKARAALLEKAKQKDPASDPEFAARQDARLAAARQREEREAERRRAKEAERERQRAERAAKAQAKAEAERIAVEEAKRRAEEARLAAEAAAKESARLSRKARPAALGLQDLKAALESRGK
ncbi:MAG: hypothetical protein KIT25_20105 [Enhydrobacter sp.]|nr:MAG: hypothetical protein KIT25_20105 [Enhydrobacter sp.]